jgi:hypothetical protein
MQVTDGTHEFAVRRNQLTNDLDVAGRIGGHDATQQAGVAARQQALSQAAIALQQQKQRQDIAATQAISDAARVRDLQGRYQALGGEESTLRKQLAAANQIESR